MVATVYSIGCYFSSGIRNVDSDHEIDACCGDGALIGWLYNTMFAVSTLFTLMAKAKTEVSIVGKKNIAGMLC